MEPFYALAVPPLIVPDAQFSDLQVNDKLSVPEIALSKAQKWKEPVNIATTTAGTLATSFAVGQTVDTLVLTEGIRILIKDQADAKENGIYVVTSGRPVRAEDLQKGMDAADLVVFVSGGVANQIKGFIVDNYLGTGIVGTDFLVFKSFTVNSSGGALTLDGHLETAGEEPTSVTGSGGLINVIFTSNSTDTAGHLIVNGTGAAGNTITVTYASPYATGMQCVFLSARNASAATAITNGYHVSTSNTQFIITFVGVSGLDPEFDYFVIDPVP